MATQQTQALLQIETQRIGYQAISLTGLRTASALNIAAGSKFELGGALYYASSDEEPSGFSAISTAATAICYAIVTGSGSTASVHFGYSSTLPAWNAAYQGWYSGANRAMYMCFKTGTTEQRGVNAIGNYNSGHIEDSFFNGKTGFGDAEEAPDGDYLFYGNTGLLIVTTNFLNSRTILNIGTQEDVLGAIWHRHDEYTIFGTNGMCRKTADSGSSWTVLTPGITGDIIYGVGGYTGSGAYPRYIGLVGRNGQMRYSSDFGVNWITTADV